MLQLQPKCDVAIFKQQSLLVSQVAWDAVGMGSRLHESSCDCKELWREAFTAVQLLCVHKGWLAVSDKVRQLWIWSYVES